MNRKKVIAFDLPSRRSDVRRVYDLELSPLIFDIKSILDKKLCEDAGIRLWRW